MKLFASLLIIVSLLLGIISTITGYLPTLDTVAASSDQGLTLNAPAGRVEVEADDPGAGPSSKPLYPKDTVLDQGIVTALRENANESSTAGDMRVRVKEFSLGRWDHAWLFALSAVGLFVGSMMMRMETRRQIVAGTQALGTSTGRLSPKQALERALDEARGLRESRETTANDESARIRELLSRIDVIKGEHFAAFIESRPMLIGTYGMAGFAQIMDRFAGADRLFARSWSAAADHCLAEAEPCLDEAITRLEFAIERLDEQ